MLSFLLQAGSILIALSPVILIVGISALLTRRRILGEHVSRGLSDGVVYLFLPCLIFDKVTAGLQPDLMPHWWALPLTALGVFLFGGALTVLFFGKRLKRDPDLFPLSFMHNAGFLVLALGLCLLPAEEEALFATFTFLYVLGHSPLLWSIGKYFISGQAATPFSWRQIVSPPLAANLCGVAVALSGSRPHIPEPILTTIHMLGAVAVPAALVVLGSSLSLIRPSVREHAPVLWRAVAIKLFLMPAILITILHFTPLPAEQPLLALMLVLQACAPQATNFMVLVRTYGGNLQRTGSVLLICYLLSLVTLPLWLALWQSL